MKNRTTFIVGNKKNSGKTTFLNGVLERLRSKGRLAYLSVGVDGETRDQIFGFDKPRVFARKGDHVVTLESALEYAGAEFKRLKTFPFKTVLGKPALVKITGDGFIEIIGPENNSQLAAILKHLRAGLGIKTILVDGAINRITQVASFRDASFVFILRVDRERVVQAANELKRIVALSRIPVAKTLNFKGPLTRHTAGAAVSKKVVVEDFTKVFLDYGELARFLKSHKLYFVNKFRLARVVVNLFGAAKDDFLKALCDKKLAGKLEINEIEY